MLFSYSKLVNLFSGIFLPGAVFFSKDNFDGKKNTMKMFSKFSRWNSFAFFWIGKFSMRLTKIKKVLRFLHFVVFIGNFILLGLYIANYLTFTCHTHPPLTKNEPCRIYESLFYVLFGKVKPLIFSSIDIFYNCCCVAGFPWIQI